MRLKHDISNGWPNFFSNRMARFRAIFLQKFEQWEILDKSTATWVSDAPRTQSLRTNHDFVKLWQTFSTKICMPLKSDIFQGGPQFYSNVIDLSEDIHWFTFGILGFEKITFAISKQPRSWYFEGLPRRYFTKLAQPMRHDLFVAYTNFYQNPCEDNWEIRR